MSRHVEGLRARERRLPSGLRGLLRVVLVALALLLVGEFVLTSMGWRQRSVPALLRERAARVERQEHGERLLAPHPTRLFTTGGGHRRGADTAGRAPTGVWPFRGRPAEPAPDHLARVVVLGDSGVHGVHLFEADTLPTQLARALEARGLPPERVAVLNLGVPGYTTLQIERLYREEVARDLRPQALVLSTALWNDRAPSSSPVGQAELLEAADPGVLSRVFAGWSARLAWLGWGGDPLRAPASPEELERAWSLGAPLYGPLVPREQAAEAMRRVVDDAVGRGMHVIALVPAHPLESLAGQKGLAADVDALRGAYAGMAAELLDGPRLLAASGLKDGAAFLDAVHPSGPWNAALAEAIADVLAPRLRGDPRAAREGRAGPVVQYARPAGVPAAGDTTLTVRVTGLPAAEVPVVMVGGQPLLDVVREEEGDSTLLRGRLGADRPGPVAVLVQASNGVARAPADVVREAPRLEYVPGSETAFPRLVLFARPGDRVAALWSAPPSASPAWGVDGDVLLARGAVPVPYVDVPCGADGRAALRIEVPPDWPPEATAIQAAVLPAGEPPGPGAAMASARVEVPAPADGAAGAPAAPDADPGGADPGGG